MIKEVKENDYPTKKKYSLYFTVYSLIKEGLNPSKICSKLDITKGNLQHYLTTLKRKGYISKIGYGVWTTNKDFNEKEVYKTTRVAKRQLGQQVYTLEEEKPDRVRGHAFQFKLKLPTNLANWDKREKIFDEIGFIYDDLMLGGIKRGQRVIFRGKKIWLMDKSIVIYEKASFMADTAQESKDYAISSIMEVVRALERQFRANFSFAGKYKFKVSRQHYALIKNALAKQYDKAGKKLEVYNNTGLWFLIDNSYNLHESETVHPKTAVKDNEKVQDFFNGLKEQEGYTPAFVVTSLANNSENLKQQTQNLDNYAVHLKSHVKSVQDLGNGVTELVKIIKELKK